MYRAGRPPLRLLEEREEREDGEFAKAPPLALVTTGLVRLCERSDTEDSVSLQAME